MSGDTPRARAAVFVAMSIDGFIARPGGAVDWLDRVSRPGEDYGYAEFYATTDALVMGRNTYELVRGFPAWPYAGKRCIVLTHRALTPAHGEEFYAGDIRALTARLAGEGVRRFYVDGGRTISAFLRERLVDELTISVIPIVLGAGIRLFADELPTCDLALEHARSWPSGLAQLRYRVQAGR